jgi:hypothetical protein
MADYWYFVIVRKGLQYPGLFLNLNGQISSQFLLDPTLKSLDVQALFTFDNRAGSADVTCHFVGHGKLHLPGIANSSGMKYGLVDLELSVAQYLKTHLPTGAYPIVTKYEIMKSRCDCGGRKAGYRDDELHGHAQWCDLVKNPSAGMMHGNGD